MMPRVVGSVGTVTRYPVKSLAGEAVPSAALEARGLVGDREWAVLTADGGIGSGKTTRRFRKIAGLLDWTAAAGAGGPPVLISPSGEVWRVDEPRASEVLSLALGQPLRLRREADVPHHDECGVHLVTTSSVRRVEQLVDGSVDVRRLRANLVIGTEGTGFVEDAWTGAELEVGAEVVLRLGAGMSRCVMVDQPQAAVTPGPPVLRALGLAHDVLLGLQAEVLRPGTLSVGDVVRLRDG